MFTFITILDMLICINFKIFRNKDHWEMNMKYLGGVREQFKATRESCNPQFSFFKKLKVVTWLYQKNCKNKDVEFCK